MSQVIYFDNNATTKIDNRVLEVMWPFFNENYGNASSKLHASGWIAEAAVEKARTQVAALLGAEPSEIIFTSGATEAVNTAITGIFKAYKSKGNHIITVKTEHKAVLDTCKFLEENEGAEVTYLDVNPEGLIDVENLMESIRPNTVLISVMAANNETGVFQPIEEIGQIARKHKVLFFSDATQYVGKMRVDLSELPIDALCFSGHKLHGPKGIGVLYLRRKSPRVVCLPLLHGGAQEGGRRAGTLNVPLIAGLGMASKIALNEMWDNNTHVSKLRAHFEHQLLEMEGITINGSTRYRLYNTSNITFPTKVNIKEFLREFAFSSGSACTSGTGELSHVLKAMGISEQEIKSSYRFSFSRYNTKEEVDLLLKAVFSRI